MSIFFRNALFHSIAVLSAVLLLLSPAIYAAERPENMDLKALQAQATQLQQNLDKNPSDYDVLLGLGVVYHALALKDSKAYAKTAVQHLERVHEKKLDDATALCYLGSAYSLLSKDASDTSTRSDYSNKGFAYMDKAVRKDPDNITVRMTRGGNARNLPRFLNRRSIAYEDFEHVIGLLEKNPKASASLKATVYNALAALYKEDGDTTKAQDFAAKAAKSEKEK
jgi:tetratricopeptide (TPR) repeat protein